jgi:hypothetical protein
VFLGAAIAITAVAQSFTGTIVGTIKDPTGAVLPGVGVKLTRTDTGQARNVATDERGDYTFVQLPVGPYRIEAELPGFKTEVRDGITVRTDVTSRVDMTMQVGEVSDKILVTEDAPLLESETSAVGNVINNRTVVDLPLNGRQFQTLVFLAPGATFARPGSSLQPRGGVQFIGMRETSNLFILDGIDITDNDTRQPTVYPSVDVIQEFKVQNSTYSAEYGRSAGGMINVTTKSGTNDLHGNLFEFVRNSMFDAKNFFDSPTQKIPPLRRNNFGGTLGGPLSLGSLYNGKNRTFFFGAFDETLERAGQTRIATVPKPEWLKGDFSSLLSPSLGSKTIQMKDPLTGQPFPGNIIPQNMLNPVALLAAQVYPAQNTGITTPLGDQFVSSPTLRTDTYLWNGRVDHQFSSNNNAFVRYSNTDQHIIDPFDAYAGISDLPFFPRNELTHTQAATISDTWTITPTTVNELRFGYDRYWQVRTNVNLTSFIDQAGLKNFDADPFNRNGYPGFLIGTSTGGFTMGKTSLPLARGDNNYEYIDNISFQKGSHNLKVGGDLTRFQVSRYSNGTYRGQFTFGTRYTGFAFSEFLLGFPEAASRAVGDTHSYLRWNAGAAFIQDDWKATNNLTLNIGVRYELYSPISDPVTNKWASVDPVTGSLIIVGNGSNPRQNFNLPETLYAGIAAVAKTIPRQYINRGDVWDMDKNNFAPRFGFAYRMGDKNVFRGGFSVFDDMPLPNIGVLGLGNNFPYTATQVQNASATTPDIVLQGDPLVNAGSGTITPAAAEMKLRTGYVQNWTLGIQRTLKNDLMLEVNYIGNKSTKLQGSHNMNQPLTDGTSVAIANRRPFPWFANVQRLDDQIVGHMSALQTKLEQRYSKGLQYTVAYTWSHSIDDDQSTQNAYNIRASMGNSAFDVRQRLVANYVYDVPIGSGKTFLGAAGRTANAILGNWQLTGIFTAQSGNYLTPVLSGNYSNVGGTDRPDAVTGVSPNLPGDQRTPNKWFNTAAFSLPLTNHWGNAGSSTIQSPGVQQLDFSLFKNFPFSEASRLQFRAEVFNILNHPNFAFPNVTINSTSAGQITSTTTSSRQIQFGMKLNF